MLSLAQYFAAIAPDIYEDAAKRVQVEAFYPLAQEHITVGVWDQFTNKAVVLWSLHNYAFNVANDALEMRGPLIHASSGEFADKTWANASGGRALSEDYQVTKYGQQYIALRQIASGGSLFPAARC